MNRADFINELVKKVESLHKIIIANKDRNTKECRHYSYNAQTGTSIKLISHEEIEEFSDLLDLVSKYSNFSQVFSSDYIENEITITLHKTLSKPDSIQEEINLLYSKIAGNSTKKWFIISEVENIRVLNDTNFRLIDCTIKLLKEEDVPCDRQLTVVGKYSLSDFIMKPCIFTSVVAGDKEKAKNLAFQNFNHSFNLLRVYFPHFKPAIKGTLQSGRYEIYTINLENQDVSLSHSRTGDMLLQEAYLDDDLYKYLQDSGIKELESNSSITKVVKNCLHWLGIGLDEDLPSAKLLNFVTILEATLKTKSESTELKLRVADRCALLLGSNFTEKKEITKYISQIYNARSKVVHTGVIIEDQNIAEIAGAYAREVLKQLIKQNSEHQGNFEKFIEKIDDKKYL